MLASQYHKLFSLVRNGAEQDDTMGHFNRFLIDWVFLSRFQRDFIAKFQAFVFIRLKG
jgi:hypothetical protein